ncbi:AAA family ATPase [Candidatus Bathyarchaeota archaeon]|nr:AAA family ATPase [Candidatus Bathyarchaeota archaeon]
MRRRELEEKINEKFELETKKASFKERIQALSERINEKLQFFGKVTNIKIELADVGKLEGFYNQARCTIEEEETETVEEMTERIDEKQRYTKMRSLLGIIGAAFAMLLAFIAGLSALTIISTLAIIFSLTYVLRKISKKQKHLEDMIVSLQQILQELKYRKRDLDKFDISEVMDWYEELKMCEDEVSRLEEETKNLDDLKSQRDSLEQEIVRIENELDDLRQYVDRYIKAQNILEREGLKSIQELEKHVKQLKNRKLMVDNEYAELDKNINKLEEEMEKLSYNEKIHRDRRREYESLLKKRSDIHGDVREIEGVIEKLSERIKDLKEEINRLQSSREKCEQLEQFVNSLKKIRDLFYRDGPLQNAIRSDAATGIENNARKLLQEFNLPFIDISVDKDFNILVYGRDGVQTLDTLSGGEKVAVALVIRLAIAAALAGESLELMIMDEPTIHLDSDRRRELVSLLKNFRKGSRMVSQLIVVSHDRELEEAADVVYEVAREGGVSKIKRLTEAKSRY